MKGAINSRAFETKTQDLGNYSIPISLASFTRLHSQATEIIELARPDSSKVELTSISNVLDAPGIGWVSRNDRLPSSFSSEEQNDHSSFEGKKCTVSY